jgi:predicted house-cleaning noncanonical NTP pyrophosphatase (MazG superfamily)
MPVKEEYYKLIRDKIPEIIAQAGYRYEIAILDDGEYRQPLGDKLQEEAQEVAIALEEAPESLLEELADLQEVIDTLIKVMGIERSTLTQLQGEKRDRWLCGKSSIIVDRKRRLAQN